MEQCMNNYRMVVLSSLEKVFPHEEPVFLPECCRFMAMPSARNRVYGLQVYKYGIEGILHWGFNFYNSDYSRRHINPCEVTDCEEIFPSGNTFLVYPGPHGIPEESIRLMVLSEAMQDQRALKLLEHYIGKEAVIELLEEDLSEIKCLFYGSEK